MGRCAGSWLREATQLRRLSRSSPLSTATTWAATGSTTNLRVFLRGTADGGQPWGMPLAGGVAGINARRVGTGARMSNGCFHSQTTLAKAGMDSVMIPATFHHPLLRPRLRPLLCPLLHPFLHPLPHPIPHPLPHLLHNFAMTMADAINYTTKLVVLLRWMAEGDCRSLTPPADGVAGFPVFRVGTCASLKGGFFNNRTTMAKAGVDSVKILAMERHPRRRPFLHST